MGGRNMIRVLGDALLQSQRFDLALGEEMTWLPTLANTNQINFGDGTTDFDMRIYMGGAGQYTDWTQSNTTVTFRGVDTAFLGAGFPRKKRLVITENTTLSATHFGGWVVSQSTSGNTVHTLPDPSTVPGAWFEHLQWTANNTTLTTATTPQMALAGTGNTTVSSVTFAGFTGHALVSNHGQIWVVSPLYNTTVNTT